VIELTDAPDGRLEGVLGAGLQAHNAAQFGYADGRKLAVLAHDPESGELVGGLLGRTTLGLFFLDLFYLPERLRGRGLGSQILRMAEAEAIWRGCVAATLVTTNFRTPEFYTRHGWQEFGRVPSVPGVERIFFRKTLS
jgi:GNAT superfamily N-acetyltransferase